MKVRPPYQECLHKRSYFLGPLWSSRRSAFDESGIAVMKISRDDTSRGRGIATSGRAVRHSARWGSKNSVVEVAPHPQPASRSRWQLAVDCCQGQGGSSAGRLRAGKVPPHAGAALTHLSLALFIINPPEGRSPTFFEVCLSVQLASHLTF